MFFFLICHLLCVDCLENLWSNESQKQDIFPVSGSLIVYTLNRVNPRLSHVFSNNACTVTVGFVMTYFYMHFSFFYLFRNFWLWIFFWGNERALNYGHVVLKRIWKLTTDHMDWQVFFLLHYLYLVSQKHSLLSQLNTS